MQYIDPCEQVEFGKLAGERLQRQVGNMEESLYSIPQVISSNNSTAGLTTNIVKVTGNTNTRGILGQLEWNQYDPWPVNWCNDHIKACGKF